MQKPAIGLNMLSEEFNRGFISREEQVTARVAETEQIVSCHYFNERVSPPKKFLNGAAL